jgi:hypothetical protein
MRQGAEPIKLDLEDPIGAVEWARAAGEADGALVAALAAVVGNVGF